MLIRFLVILALTSIGGSSDLILADDTEQVLICTYEDLCPKNTVVRTAVGYGINIRVKNVDLDGENGDFLLIKSGTEIDDGLHGVKFNYNIENERKYISLINEVFIHFHVNQMNNEVNGHSGFVLSVQRFVANTLNIFYKYRNWRVDGGSPISLYQLFILDISFLRGRHSYQIFIYYLPDKYLLGTAITTAYAMALDFCELIANVKKQQVTDRQWLLRGDRKNERDLFKFPHLNSHFPSITVNMRMLEPFNETLYIFRETVAMLGQDYVDNVDGFNLTEPISENDVHVTVITPCPIHWPDRATCYRITFALPIEYDDSGSYQLNEYHLHLMWQNASYFFNEENTPTVTIYTNHYYQFVPWIITISVVIGIFAISYLIIGCVLSRMVKIKRMKTKALEEQVQRSFNSDHKDDPIYNMDPNPFQTVPPLFQNDMTYFDPDKPTESPPRRITSQHDNLDENLLNVNNMQLFQQRRSSTSA